MTPSQTQAKTAPRRDDGAAARVLGAPPRWLALYGDFIAKNADQVSQIESALRSLTYIIPGRFRDAEIASESIHSGVQLLSLYHDNLLSRASSTTTTTTAAARSAHARYTRYWTHRSPLYRRVALVLQMLGYTQLLCEMAAKRRAGNAARWRVVVLIEAAKALCRLLLLRATRDRPLLSPALPEREAVVPPAPDEDDDGDGDHGDGEGGRPAFLGAPAAAAAAHERDWTMPRTGMSLPSLPEADDISSYLLGRVLTADDIKPAAKLLNRLRGAGRAAEVLHLLAPVVYAAALARGGGAGARSWTPWLVGLGVEYAARQLRDGSLRTTALERDEWNKRAWAMAWWAMRGAFYDKVTKGVVGGLRRRMPAFVAGVVDDYEYLWENYYFSTSA